MARAMHDPGIQSKIEETINHQDDTQRHRASCLNRKLDIIARLVVIHATIRKQLAAFRSAKLFNTTFKFFRTS
jgi:hypothetical protein